jgi:hypothetical protein
MRRFFFLVLLIFLFVSQVPAQSDSFTGTVEVSFGKVRGLDGTWRSVKGLRLPFFAQRIQAAPIGKGTVKILGGGGGEDGTTVFNADAGSNYGFIEDPDPSSLDDMTMVGAAGKPWENLTFGVDIGVQHNFLIRWTVYDSMVAGRGHDASAFEPYFPNNNPPIIGIADFGVIFPATAPGTWKITISVEAAGVVCPDNGVFMAQQFREPQLNGEGPFDLAMRNVYNSSAPVTVGSSDNVFWYDWDTRNGIYSEDEADNFGEGTFANLLRTITVTSSGQQNVISPFSVAIPQGYFVSGELPDVMQSDDLYYKGKPRYNVSRATPPLQIEVEGLSPVASVLSFKFSAEVAASSSGGQLLLYLFNYSTNLYDLVSTTTISNTDTLIEVPITANISRYINQTNRRMKSKIGFKPPNTISRSWTGRVDHTFWTITR